MNDITRQLRDADPVTREPGLTPEAIAELRRVVVTAAHERARVSFPQVVLRTFAVAAAAALIVGAGVVANRRPAVVTPAPLPAAAPAATERTQVQFSTPGGTRIVWTIDPAFQIKGNR